MQDREDKQGKKERKSLPLCQSLRWAWSQVRFFCLALRRKFKVKSPGGLGHWIKNRKGAEKTYYFLVSISTLRAPLQGQEASSFIILMA